MLQRLMSDMELALIFTPTTSNRILPVAVVTYAVRVLACIDEINSWMTSNRPVMNPAKTDVYSSHDGPVLPLTPVGTCVPPSIPLYTTSALRSTKTSR